MELIYFLALEFIAFIFRPLSVGGGFMRVNGNPMENNVGHNHNHVQPPATPLPQVVDNLTTPLPQVVDNPTLHLRKIVDNPTIPLPQVVDNPATPLPQVI